MIESKNLQRNVPIAMEVLMLGLLIIVCNLLGGLLSLGLESHTGFDLASQSEVYLKEHRWILRGLLLLSNACLFLLPGLFCSILLYKREWLASVRADVFPNKASVGLGIAAIFFSLGMVAYAFYLNQLIPLPEWVVSYEERSAGLISAVMQMDSLGEWFINLIIIALIPAIGEEWIFRGILQGRISRWLKNGHLRVWLVAIIFSAVHFQFQGFLPRVLLGAMLGYMYLWSGSLWLPIIAHFFNNASQVTYYYIATKMEGMDVPDVSEVPDVAWWQGLLSMTLVVGLMLILRFVSNKSAVRV